MSSITRIRARSSHRGAFQLDKMLGAGGCELMLKTMTSITDGSQGLSMAEEAAEQMSWRHLPVGADRLNTYRLTLAGRSLPETLRSQQVDQLQIDLTLGPSIATIVHRITMATGVAQASPSVREDAQMASNQSVNQVLAMAVARKLAERVSEYTRQQQEQAVRIRVSQSLDIRAHAFVNR